MSVTIWANFPNPTVRLRRPRTQVSLPFYLVSTGNTNGLFKQLAIATFFHLKKFIHYKVGETLQELSLGSLGTGQFRSLLRDSSGGPQLPTPHLQPGTAPSPPHCSQTNP